MALRKFLFLSAFLVCFVGIVFLALFGKKTIPRKQQYFYPTPSPIPMVETSHTIRGPILLNTDPGDAKHATPLDTKIILAFDREVLAKDINFSIVPNFSYTATVSGKTYTITPQENLSPNTTYTYFLTIHGIIAYILSFTTVKNNVPLGTTDFSSDVQNELNKHNNPDVYLAQYTPYNTQYFSIISSYSNTTASFSFTLLYYVDKKQAIEEFTRWAENLGITAQQIQLLNIRYLQPNPGF